MPIQILIRVYYFKSILHQGHSALNWLLNAFFLFVPVSLQMTSTSRQLRSGWGYHPSAPDSHKQSVFILEQSVCLFVKGVDQNTPQSCRFQSATPPIINSPSLLYLQANSEISFFFFLLVSLILPVWSYNPLLRLSHPAARVTFKFTTIKHNG